MRESMVAVDGCNIDGNTIPKESNNCTKMTDVVRK